MNLVDEQYMNLLIAPPSTSAIKDWSNLIPMVMEMSPTKAMHSYIK